MKFISASLLGLIALVASTRAQAIANCSVSVTTVAFGSYNPFSGSVSDSTSTIQVSCSLGGLISLGVSYEIKLSAGGAGSYAPRRMSSGANTLNYNLYTSNARTTVWGNGTGSTGTISDGYLLGLFTVNRNYTVYGRVPALQNARGGAYADTITVTVNY